MDGIESPYGFERPMPMGIRLMLAAAGIFCIVMPAYEFWPVLRQPTLLSLFFGAIVLGAWSVGGGFIFAAIHGAHQKWTFRDGALTIDQKTLFRSWQTHVRGADIQSTAVHENHMDGPNTFSVILKLKNGTSHETHGLNTEAAAEAFRQRIVRYLQGS